MEECASARSFGKFHMEHQVVGLQVLEAQVGAHGWLFRVLTSLLWLMHLDSLQ